MYYTIRIHTFNLCLSVLNMNNFQYEFRCCFMCCWETIDREHRACGSEEVYKSTMRLGPRRKTGSHQPRELNNSHSHFKVNITWSRYIFKITFSERFYSCRSSKISILLSHLTFKATPSFTVFIATLNPMNAKTFLSSYFYC